MMEEASDGGGCVVWLGSEHTHKQSIKTEKSPPVRSSQQMSMNGVGNDEGPMESMGMMERRWKLSMGVAYLNKA